MTPSCCITHTNQSPLKIELYETRQTVQVKLRESQELDPDSPLYSVKSFEELGL